MNFSRSRLSGLVLIDLDRLTDERGFFARTACREEFAKHKIPTAFAQDSLSHNLRRGTLRGLHFQRTPYAEAKLVRCTRGAILDVVVDMRVDSRTWLDWEAYLLSADNGRALFIPEGFAHGFQTLEDRVDVSYRITQPYRADAASGLRYDDPALAIPWPEPVASISERDRSWPVLALGSSGDASRAQPTTRTKGDTAAHDVAVAHSVSGTKRILNGGSCEHRSTSDGGDQR